MSVLYRWSNAGLSHLLVLFTMSELEFKLSFCLLSRNMFAVIKAFVNVGDVYAMRDIVALSVQFAQKG